MKKKKFRDIKTFAHLSNQIQTRIHLTLSQRSVFVR